MQPETNLKIKANDINKAANTEAPPLIWQWDQVAHRLIAQELAPKGFKKVNHGVHKGSEIANSKFPGISRFQVTACQRIASQMVRSFRARLKRTCESRVKYTQEQADKRLSDLRLCAWWEFQEKARLKKERVEYLIEAQNIRTFLSTIENLPVQ
jgi:hypothetical protein